MQKYITPLITGAFALLTYSAQAQKCGHDLLEAEVDRVYPERAAQWQEFINTLDFDNHSHAAENVFTIPVVVHVIYDGPEDNISEKQIQDAMTNLIRGRTTIGIAHRLSTLRNANRLIVIDDGRIAETGSHDELLAKNGIYARLVQMQTEISSIRGKIWGDG